MTAQILTAYLDDLERTAHKVSADEETYRREAAARFRELEQARAFAFRRLNLMRTVIDAVTGIEEEEEAIKTGTIAFMREVEWSGATEAQRQAIEQFNPVVLAAWQLSRTEGDAGDTAGLTRALADFEQWFSNSRNSPFLTVMEREVVELPLVEV
ncbi:MAG TPA: hypothetical protein VNQ56_03375 [Pseudolabrys sp.]|nr:hypothetical protein [Pseudolabrys sp.]